MESKDKSTAEAAFDSTLKEIDAGTLSDDQSVVCRSLLTALSQHSDLAAKVAEIFAALGRDSSSRDVASECCVLQSLVPLLSSDQSELRLQAMRAVGNLCIDHDVNRETVLSNEGCPYLIDQLTRCLDASTPDSQSDRIKCVTCGCILNLSNENEKLQKEFLSLGVLSGLSNILSVPDQSEMVLQMALQATSILLEHSDLTTPPSTSLPSALTLLLTRCSQGELDLMENVFEIIATVIQQDVWKRALVKEGCVEILLKYAQPDLEQKANDFLVTFLGEDECLDVIFKEGKVLSSALACLHSDTSSLHQRANAALIIANMARSEEKCVVLIEKGVVPILIALTKMEETKELMGKLHHSALSALRNLSLPVANKQLFLECGVVEAALSSLRTTSLAHVWFKDLGILRLLVDKQAATCSYIVSQNGTIERVCEVCSAVGPAHLQIEGSRLFAAIVKNSQGNDVRCKVVSGGGIKWICSLLDSEHDQLVNEGLISLNLLAALKEELVYSSLVELDPSIDSRLSQTLSSASLPVEVISNALALVEALIASGHDPLKSKLKGSKDLITSLEGLSKHAVQDINSRALKLFVHLSE